MSNYESKDEQAALDDSGVFGNFGNLDAINSRIREADLDGADQKMTYRFLTEQAFLANQPADVMQFAVELMRVNQRQRELSPKQRKNICAAFKEIACGIRDAWHSIKIDHSPSEERQLATLYRKELEKELVSFVSKSSDVLDTMLEMVPKDHLETQVCFLSIIADLHRYVAECDSSISLEGGMGGRGAEASSSAVVMKLYSRAWEAAKALSPNNPVRLGVALNLSVFCNDILGDTERADSIATTAFNMAISKLDELHDSRYKETGLLMQLLRDNLTMWKQSKQSAQVEASESELDDLL